jgi:hypothetical protein
LVETVVNNPGRSQKIVISPCAQFRAATTSRCATPVDRNSRTQKIGLALRQPNHRFVID